MTHHKDPQSNYGSLSSSSSSYSNDALHREILHNHIIVPCFTDCIRTNLFSGTLSYNEQLCLNHCTKRMIDAFDLVEEVQFYH